MMAKKDVSSIISGMGVGASILDSLAKAAKEHGLTDEDIHKLATPEGEPLFERFAKLMAATFQPQTKQLQKIQKGEFSREFAGLFDLCLEPATQKLLLLLVENEKTRKGGNPVEFVRFLDSFCRNSSLRDLREKELNKIFSKLDEYLKEFSYDYKKIESFLDDISWYRGVSWGEKITNALIEKGLEIRRKLTDNEWGQYLGLSRVWNFLKKDEFKCLKHKRKSEDMPFSARMWGAGYLFVEKTLQILDKVSASDMIKIGKIAGFLYEEINRNGVVSEILAKSEEVKFDVDKTDDIAIQMLKSC